jgi:ATP-dependent helicase Lhr and Lhr-like helicase
VASNSTSSAFHQLHPSIQRWIWEQHWNELRDIQEQAIAPILAGDTDLIIAAATAGGKTEAAFLPIFSNLITAEPQPGVQVLAVSPLKALINDQHRRLEELGERLEIAVHPWHGDISSARKQRLLKQPSGVLLITPEALEAMFILRGHELLKLFGHLRYVVIDELHSFMGSERGQQLRSLLHRLEQVIGRRVPRLGLSATLGEMNLAKEYLRAEDAKSVRLIVSEEAGQEIKLQIRGYRKTLPLFLDEQAEADTEGARDEIDIAEHLFKVLRGSKNLIFINRRQAVEQYTDLLGRLCETHRVPNEFMPHYGSLSKELRQAAEEALKERNRPANVICTSTLELGIDIGSVATIAQIGPPYSVASTRQRLGRSGRQSDPAVLRLYISEPEVTPITALEDTLHPALMQAIAVVNLLLQGWYEPPQTQRLHLSTLIQQLLSLIAQQGGVRPDQAWQILHSSFQAVNQATFVQLLRCLGEQDLIQQSQDGLLLLGLTGERLVNHYSFYTAFQTPEEFRVTAVGKTLGTLPIDYPLVEGMYLIFAGKRWQVLTIDRRHRVIDVQQASAGRVPYFSGSAGIVHDRIRQEMWRLYLDSEVPIFLDTTAQDLLREARAYFHRYSLDQRYLVEAGSSTLLFSWMGSTVMNTLALQLAALGLKVETGTIALTVNNITPQQLLRRLQSLANADLPDTLALAATVSNKIIEKHDLFLSEPLLCQNYAASYLNVQKAWNTLRQIVSEPLSFS